MKDQLLEFLLKNSQYKNAEEFIKDLISSEPVFALDPVKFETLEYDKKEKILRMVLKKGDEYHQKVVKISSVEQIPTVAEEFKNEISDAPPGWEIEI